MKAILSLSRRATYADYLAAEQHSESRLELIDGVIVAMAGGSNELPRLTRAIAVDEIYDGILDLNGASLLR